MIDYILKFPDEATAIASLSDWRFTDEEDNTDWAPKPKCGIIEIKVILEKAVWDNSDPEISVLVSPEIISNGYWMAIATPEPDDNLWSQSFVVSEHDREQAAQGHAHLLRTKLTDEQLAGVAGIRPVFTGSNYPF